MCQNGTALISSGSSEMQLIGVEGRESTKVLGMLDIPWQVFFKIEENSGTEERMAGDLSIEEDIQIKIKATL